MLKHTPIEIHYRQGRAIHVKREDLCCEGVAFSKMRGVEAHIRKRPEHNIAVLDTYHSKAGWGVSQVCRDLGKKCYLFYPEYKGEEGLRENQLEALKNGAVLCPLPATRSFILYNQVRGAVAALPDIYLMPNALKLEETVEETRQEVQQTIDFKVDNVIVSVSSGTLASGVISGFDFLHQQPKYWLHLGYSRERSAVEKYLTSRLNYTPDFELIDEKYAYKDGLKFDCPFPCNPYYDLKAWAWLCYHTDLMNGTILFWNIGK
jgi:hypothetical protein